MKSIKVGLLPFYVSLYDSASPQMRTRIELYYSQIADTLTQHGLSVITHPVCCEHKQFIEAVHCFEKQDAQAIVTLHLAYSPSLESEQALAGTKLPLIVLDTTPDYLFDTSVDSDNLLYNHGIHGVQDMCNLLRRNQKPFVICAGHARHSDVISRVVLAAQSAAVWSRLSKAKVGIVGNPFNGMGDFRVADDVLTNRLGIEVVKYPLGDDDAALRGIAQQQLDDEFESDAASVCMNETISRTVYDATERVALALRKWVDDEALSAFTINFGEAGRHVNLPTMPFSEPCKAMARGIGYAGEGDVLTAAFVGALLSVYPDTTFAEMFCPNWQGNSIFFSHMGEFNLRIADGKPHMILKEFPYAPGFDPTSIVGHFKSGQACFANLAPTRDGFKLVLADGEILQLAERIAAFEDVVSGWFRPAVPIADFLEAYSYAGGTHHGALIYGANANDLKAIAVFADMECAVID